MNYSDYRFTLDVQIHQAQVSVPVTFGDSARKLCIGLTDGRKPYVIGEGCRAVFNAKKPDGTVIKNDCIIERNTILYEFTANTTNAEGVVNCDITIVAADGKVLTSPQFIIVVDKRVVRDEEILSQLPEDKRSTLDNMIAAEIARDAAESNRVKAESERKEKESARRSDEVDRNDREVARILAESERHEREIARVEAETNRIWAETAREDAEEKRKYAEGEVSSGSSYYGGRALAEYLRSVAEENRVEAEKGRVAKMAEIEALVGDIGTALDAILAIQESLIGGGA